MQPFIIVLKRKTLPFKTLPLLCRTDEMDISEHELLLRNDVSINPTSLSPSTPPFFVIICLRVSWLRNCVSRHV